MFVFKPVGLWKGFFCVPRMENQQKRTYFIQEWSHEKSLVGDLRRGFYYRNIISGTIWYRNIPSLTSQDWNFNASRYIKVYDISLSSGMFHGYFHSSPGISCVFFSCVCMVGHNTSTSYWVPTKCIAFLVQWSAPPVISPHPSLVEIVTPGKFQVLGILYGWGSNPHTLRMLRYYAPGTQMIWLRKWKQK